MPHVEIPQSLCLAGVARGDITPPVGMYHRMWGAATHDRSTGVHRPLTATVLALRPVIHEGGDGESSAGSADDRAAEDDAVLLVSLDHCIISDADLADMRARAASAASVD